MPIVTQPSPKPCRQPLTHPDRGVSCAETATLHLLFRRYTGLLRDPTTVPGLLLYCRAVLDEIESELQRRRGRGEEAA